MGGAYGHMNHPFNLDQIQTGQQLIDFFLKDIVGSMSESPAALKLDGVNASIKVVDYNGTKQFAGDRGSSIELDVSGITRDQVQDRWMGKDGIAREHGMVPAYQKVLDIFNSSIHLIRPELEELRMWDNPTRFFNTEFVEITEEEKQTNVVEYDNSYIAIHGLAQFYEKKGTGRPDKYGRSGFDSIDRPGLPRPVLRDAQGNPMMKKGNSVLIKDKGTPIPYDQNILNSLVEKMKPIAEHHGFQIYSTIPTKHKEDHTAEKLQAEFKKVLDTNFPLCIDDTECPVNLSLGEWLSRAQNPVGVPPQGIRVVTKENPIDPFNKDIYMYGVPPSPTQAGRSLYDLLKGGPDENLMVTYPGASGPVPATRAFVDAIVFWEAIRRLGNVVKRSLTSAEFGHVDNQEGVVIRDKKFGTVPVQDPETGETFEMPLDVKITGDFIVQGLDTKFGDAARELKEVYEADLMSQDFGDRPDPVSSVPERVALFPGSFKPPHRGHLNALKQLGEMVDRVIVYVSDPMGPGAVRMFGDNKSLTADDAINIWNLYLNSDPELKEKVELRKGAVKESIDLISSPAESEGSLGENSTVVLGCGDKGFDVSRFAMFEQYRDKFRPDIKFEEGVCNMDAKHTTEYIEIASIDPKIMAGLKKITDDRTGLMYPDPDLNASDFRFLLGLDNNVPSLYELINDFVPKGVDIDIIMELITNVKSEIKKKVLSMHSLYSLVEQTLDEISGCAAGSVSGAPGNVGAEDPQKRDDKKKKKTLKEWYGNSLYSKLIKEYTNTKEKK